MNMKKRICFLFTIALLCACVCGCTKKSQCEWVEGHFFTGVFHYHEEPVLMDGVKVYASLEYEYHGMPETIDFKGNIANDYRKYDSCKVNIVCQLLDHPFDGPFFYKIKCIEKIQ